jgi:hypothetical protein
VPAWQVVPPLQTFAHDPQFALSDCSFTHEVPHELRPPVHATVHVPPEHTWLPVQRLPHVPQLFGSVCVLVHAPLHAASPVGQTHASAVQVWPAAQAMPQLPQSFVSVCRFTQALAQSVSPAPHVVVQTPVEQT